MTARIDGGTVLAAIDIGTVSTRLMAATVDGARIEPLERDARITDLGEGVDRTGRLAPAAVERTVGAVADYVGRVRRLAAEAGRPVPVAVTTTSAARDAANAASLLDPLRELGLLPQVIEGTVEARLALLGVTADFAQTPVLVADVGGGSTELTVGVQTPEGMLEVGACASFNVGCRRLAERFALDRGPADAASVASARSLVRTELGPFVEQALRIRPDVRPVCVGGTATSLVAVAHGLVPYDSAFVHLRFMGTERLGLLTERLLELDADERAALPGLQAKRAAVIAAGALIVDELVRLGGWDGYTASESDSLIGLLACMKAALAGTPSPFGWAPRTAFIA